MSQVSSTTSTPFRTVTIQWLRRRQAALELALQCDDQRLESDAWVVATANVDETQTSAHFKDFTTAWQYYQGQGGTSYQDVQDKISEGLITVGYHPHAVSYNEEGRAIIRTPRAVAQRKMKEDAQKKRHVICGLVFDGRTMQQAVERALLTMTQKAKDEIEINSKAALERTVTAACSRFEEELPYCGHGKPFYSAEAFKEQEMKRANRRARRFRYRDKCLTLVHMRRCRNSPYATHWGMDDALPWTMLFDEDCRLLTWPSLHPTKREIMNLIKTCK
jgi:hypothetical protein